MRFFSRRQTKHFVILSAFIHLAFWMGLRWLEPVATKPKETIEFTILDQRPNEKRMQIVEQPKKPLNDEVPEDAKYLSQFNQRVVKETRAINQGDFRNSSGHGGAEQSPKTAQSNPAKSKPRTRGTLPTLKDLRPKFDPTTANYPKPTDGGRGPASQTNDYLKNQPPSLETLLNTREFVYYTYYQRIRSQIRQYWEPAIRQKVKRIFAQGRGLASERDHITRVVIILDHNGSLLKVQVVSQSGIKDLDEAAVDAFRAAEPFPNPPKGIVENDGKIRINWDFILEA